jgi:hypothetical protein
MAVLYQKKHLHGIWVFSSRLKVLFEPYSSDSFYHQMLRSEVFSAAPSEWKDLALWLMLMAFFCDRLETTSDRVGAYIDSCAELGYPLEKLRIESFCALRRIESKHHA